MSAFEELVPAAFRGLFLPLQEEKSHYLQLVCCVSGAFNRLLALAAALLPPVLSII